MTYVAVAGWHDRRRLAPLGGLVAAVVLLTVVGVGLAGVLLPGPAERAAGRPVAAAPSPPGPTTAPAASDAAASGTAAPSEAPSPAQSPPPPVSDTIAFRLERVPVALTDLATSPIIGLGAESFGQRHLDPTIGYMPDHIAILAIAVPYESGVVGSIALISAFAILVIGLWRAASQVMAREAAAAYLASIATLAVAYQATNALHFAINWLIVGAAVALAAHSVPVEPTDPQDG